MDIKKYLDRIGVENVSTSYDTLLKLQIAHYKTVPYENLDILAGKALNLTPEAVYKKVVEEGRGGYCFELNGLYGELLKEIGFKYTERLARFLKGESEIPMGRHRILLVELDDKIYVCDVGIGCPTPTEPLELNFEIEQSIGDTKYRFRKDPMLYNVLEYLRHGQWEPYYSFGNELNLPCDFVAPSVFCELSPNSIFNKGPMVHIFTDKGRISVENTEIKFFEDGNVTVRTFKNDVDYKNCLKEYFGIEL